MSLPLCRGPWVSLPFLTARCGGIRTPCSEKKTAFSYGSLSELHVGVLPAKVFFVLTIPRVRSKFPHTGGMVSICDDTARTCTHV